MGDAETLFEHKIYKIRTWHIKYKKLNKKLIRLA